LEDSNYVGLDADGQPDYDKAIEMVARVPDGLRHLRNFAKNSFRF